MYPLSQVLHIFLRSGTGRATLRRVGLLSKLGEGRRTKVVDFVQAHLEPGETVQAVLPMTQTGNPAWMDIAFVSFFGIAVTDRRVHFVRWGRGVPERPEEVFASLPRHTVSVETWKKGFGSSKLALRGGPGDVLEVDVPGMHKKDAEALVAALSPGQPVA